MSYSVYDDGYKAYFAGYDVYHCPYLLYTREYSEWVEGWYDAELECSHD